MPLISGATAAASAVGGGGLVGKGTSILKDTVGNVGDIADDATSRVGGALGIGPGKEEVKGVPDGFPDKTPSGPIAGEVFQGGTGDNVPYNKSSLKLRPGVHDYGDLSSAGVHDKISGIKIKDGYEAVFFKGVEGGKPSGDSMKVTGPKAIPELRDYKPGFENSISSIAVRKIPERGSGGGSVDPGTGTGNGGGSSGGSGGGSGGSTGGGSYSPPGRGDVPRDGHGGVPSTMSGSSNSQMIILAAAAGVLLYIANMG